MALNSIPEKWKERMQDYARLETLVDEMLSHRAHVSATA